MNGRTLAVVVLAALGGCDAVESADASVADAVPFRQLDPALPAELVVKLAGGSSPTRGWTPASGSPSWTPRPVFSSTGAALAAAQSRSGRALPEFGTWFRVSLDGASDASEKVAFRHFAEDLRRDPNVEFVTLRSPPPPPADIAPTTPDYADEQVYLTADGIDAQGAWAMGFDGAGVRIADVEYGWNAEHEEFNERDLHPQPGQTVADEAYEMDYAPDHGTAALALVAGDPGEYGVRGIAPASEIYTYPEWTTESGFRRAEAIANAMVGLVPGDVLMLEMQIGDPTLGSFGPAELDEDVWLLTRMATDSGITVVAASGNGGLDLDAPALDYYRDRGDSGAIVVAAGDPLTNEALPYSTFGARADLHAWGAGVFTAGYGDFAQHGDDPNQGYTADFQGSSAAAPMVAAAVALIQQAAISAGEPLTPRRVREILVATGTPQGMGPNIGPLPDVVAAISVALEPEDEPPTVTIVLPSEDLEIEVEPGALYETEIEIDADDASGYIYAVELRLNGEPESVPDKSRPFKYPTAGFPAGTWDLVAIATDAWGNQTESAPRRLVVVETEPVTGVESSTSGEPDGSTGEEDASSGGATGDGPPTQSEGDGCGCSAGSPPFLRGGAGLLLLFGLLRPRHLPPGVLRKRRRSNA